MSTQTNVVRRRKARKQWLCAGDWAHDRTIRPGSRYCEVTVLPSENFSRDVALIRLCDHCGREEHPEYVALCVGEHHVEGQMSFEGL